MKANSELFIRALEIDWKSGIKNTYVSAIPAIRKIKNFTFNNRVTLFAGENGSGKSTLLEAIAVAFGLNAEGGTDSYHFSTYEENSPLAKAVKLTKGIKRPKKSIFLRAESFYNAATEAVKEYNYDGKMQDYHIRSHGESFLEFVSKWDSKCLFMMDEPEAALSPRKQLTLLRHIYTTANEGSQYIIATHSPILLGLPNADIYSFDNGKLHPVAYEDTESYAITKVFLQNRNLILDELLGE